MKAVKTMRFPGQKQSEEVQLLIRKHWVIDVITLSIFMVIVGLPLGVGAFFGIALWEDLESKTALFYLLGFLIYSLYAILFVYLLWLNEELDIVIITNERVITHNQIDTFHRQIGEASIKDVQDVKGVEKGVLGHLFHFGVLKITTSSNEQFFDIQNIDRPYDNASHMLDIRDHVVRLARQNTP